MKTQKSIKVSFKVETVKGTYQDCLYFTESEYNALTQQDIDALGQKRADDWVAFLNNPPAPVELTPEELQAESDRVAGEILQLQSQKVELDNQIALEPIIK